MKVSLFLASAENRLSIVSKSGRCTMRTSLLAQSIDVCRAQCSSGRSLPITEDTSLVLGKMLVLMTLLCLGARFTRIPVWSTRSSNYSDVATSQCTFGPGEHRDCGACQQQ